MFCDFSGTMNGDTPPKSYTMLCHTHSSAESSVVCTFYDTRCATSNFVPVVFVLCAVFTMVGDVYTSIAARTIPRLWKNTDEYLPVLSGAWYSPSWAERTGGRACEEISLRACVFSFSARETDKKIHGIFEHGLISFLDHRSVTKIWSVHYHFVSRSHSNHSPAQPTSRPSNISPHRSSADFHFPILWRRRRKKTLVGHYCPIEDSS